jgi:hypothetical protein
MLVASMFLIDAIHRRFVSFRSFPFTTILRSANVKLTVSVSKDEDQTLEVAEREPTVSTRSPAAPTGASNASAQTVHH